MPNYLNRVVYLSAAQKEELFTTGTTSGNGEIISYDDNDLYVVAEDSSGGSIGIATDSEAGIVQPWYSHTTASTGPTAGSDATAVTVNSISTTAGKYYAVEADSNGRMFVNVPWTGGSSTSYTSFSGKPTANQTPAFGGTFTISQIAQDSTGQVSGTDRTITIPSTTVSSTSSGLAPKGASVSTQSQTTKFLREDGTWAAPSYSSGGTDENVIQTATTTDSTYEILFSGTADNTTRTEGAHKTSTLTYNPSTKALSTGGTINTYTLADACEKSVDSSISSSSNNLPTSSAVFNFVSLAFLEISSAEIDAIVV